jgi:hypothetical protein
VADLDRKGLEQMWAALAGEDAARAHQAVAQLAAVPARAVPFLEDRLRPVTPPDPERVGRLLADLGSYQFAVREAASRGLAELGPQAEPALHRALGAKPALEVRLRLDALLAETMQAARGAVRSPEVLRTLRAIRVLERTGTPEAQGVLRALAAGAPGARETDDARAALRRLARRPAPP